MNLSDKFKIVGEKEDFEIIISNIQNGIELKGTNLWILIFAIFIASLGLNVNSTAVIIGAMLISPLMGPIIGLGFGMGVNDLAMVKRSFVSYLLSVGAGLATSTIFFLLSPINDAHSEILARTSPSLSDVFIALFGGFAGILATSSKPKGNVIPGVAIATALMPPLCTAGYGLATLQFHFFFGAFYLFIINTVFIALATLITIRFLKFPFKHLPEERDEIRAKRIIWAIATFTLLPSIYFGYDIVQKNKFKKQADKFIENEAVFENNYLLKKDIDLKKKSINLTYGGQAISADEIKTLKSKLPKYDLSDTILEVRQGFAYLNDDKKSNNEQANNLTIALGEKENQIRGLQAEVNEFTAQNKLTKQVLSEIKTQFPNIQSLVLQPVTNLTDSTQQTTWIAIIHSKGPWSKADKPKIENWLKVRINLNEIKVYYKEIE